MIRTLKHKENIRILESNYIGNLSYIYKDKPFIVPITYYFDKENNTIIGYSDEGHKITAMRKNNTVSLNILEVDSINMWQSVLVHGKFIELLGSNAKTELHKFSLGVKDLIINKEHRKLDFISEFSSKIHRDNFPVVFLIKIEELTGRIRRH